MFGSGVLISEDHVVIEEKTLAALVPQLARKHARTLLAHELHMVELEFPGLPPEERFYRFGTDPRFMVAPMQIIN